MFFYLSTIFNKFKLHVLYFEKNTGFCNGILYFIEIYKCFFNYLFNLKVYLLNDRVKFPKKTKLKVKGLRKINKFNFI